MKATASDKSRVEMAGRDIVHLYGRDAEAPGLFSVDLPQASSTFPLRGRDALIDKLSSAISEGTSGHGQKVFILHGPGGCGKSRIVRELGHRAALSGIKVWWLYAAGPARISAEMREVASRLGGTEAMLENAWAGKASATDLVWRLLNSATEPWLLIFDNADDPSLLAPVGGAVAHGTGWLRPPISPHGVVLVTSRIGNPRTWGPWSELHRVDVLDPADGAEILLDLAGERAGDRTEAEALAQRLGGLPLALKGAGTHLNSQLAGPVWRQSKAIRSFADYKATLDARFEDPRGLQEDGDLGLELVRQTCDVSLGLLDQRGMPQARALLRLLACFANFAIPFAAVLNPLIISESALFGSTTEDRLRHLLDGLTELALVDTYTKDDIADPSYVHLLTLHPLVHDVSRNQVAARRTGRAYLTLMVALLTDTVRGLDPDDTQAWPQWNLLAPHCAWPTTRYLGTALSEDDPDSAGIASAMTLIRLVARYLLAVGLPGQAQRFLQPVLDLLARIPAGEIIEDRGLALRHEYGRALLEQGRLDAAERELAAVLDARIESLGATHLDTLATRHKLARSILEQGRWVDAETQLREVVKGERHGRGVEHNDTLIVWHSLALALLRQQRFDEAEKELHEIIIVRMRLGEADRRETLVVRHTLAQVLAAKGHESEATRELTAVLAQQILVLGSDHPETVTTRADLDHLQSSR